MFNLFTFVNFGALECLRASKLPRALGKFFSLVRAQYLSLIDDAKVLIKNEIEEYSLSKNRKRLSVWFL